MSVILETKSLYYNDVNLIAQPGQVSSRNEIPKELNRIIVSPMDAVIGETFAKEADRLGLTLCLHRFCSPEKQLNIFSQLKNRQNVFISVGINDLDRINLLHSGGAENFLLDIANGYIPNLRTYMYRIYDSCKNIKKIMIGNVMTGSGFYNATMSMLDTYIRCGIAGGSGCSTMDSTGYNRGQITELIEIKKTKDSMGQTNGKQNYIIADGGIKNGNYAAKAFGCGADYIMIGGLFGRAKEAETHVIGDGTFWGGASHKQQERYGGIKKHSEGKVYHINHKIEPLEELVFGEHGLWEGLKSAISYSGKKTLTEFIGNGIFEIKQNSLPPKDRY